MCIRDRDETALRGLMDEMKRDGVPINGFLDRCKINIIGQKITIGVCHEMCIRDRYTAGQKDPDFILRPSGEKRLSNFMLCRQLTRSW